VKPIDRDLLVFVGVALLVILLTAGPKILWLLRTQRVCDALAFC
jgi:hypothetical protein